MQNNFFDGRLSLLDQPYHCFIAGEVFIRNSCSVLVNNQLDARFFFVYVYYNSLHVSSTHVLIIRRIISTRHLVYVTLCRWLSGMQVCVPVTYIEWHIPDVVLIQLVLLMSTWVFETENWNKHIRKRIVHQVGYLQELYWDARPAKHKINDFLFSITYLVA